MTAMPDSVEPAECWHGCDDPQCPYTHERIPPPVRVGLAPVWPPEILEEIQRIYAGED